MVSAHRWRLPVRALQGLGVNVLTRSCGQIGESWPGLLSGSQKHYDASGRYIGYSARGFVADMVHHDTHGKYIGETHTGLFRQKKHYNADGSCVGETWEDFLGETTLVGNSDQINLPDTEDFFNDDDR